MLLKRPSTQNQEKIKGIYMTKESRMETRNEICRAHFNLGSPEVSKCTSFNKHLEFPAQSFSQAQFSISNGEVKVDNKKIAAEIKKLAKEQHFTVGNPIQRMESETSNFATFGRPNSNYRPMTVSQINLEAKQELRKSHFNFGSDAMIYQTTN